MKKQFGAICLLLLFLRFNQPIQAQALPTLLITERFYDTPGDESMEEWVEIANVGTAVIDLTSIKIGDEEKAGGREGMRRFPEGATIDGGQVIVVAQTAVGFHNLYGFNPDYEIIDSDEAVPNMRGFPLWAGGDVAFANDGDEVLLLAENNALIDSLNYGDSQADGERFFSPAIVDVSAGVSLERHPANCDTNSATDWQPQETPTPGTITLDDACREPINPADLEELPPIGMLQGTGDVSPLINQTVTFRGVVTGNYADTNLSGITFHTLFVQDLVGHEDGDPATSDGIALFLGRQRPSYPIGTQLRITGQLTEFFGYTELDDNNLEIIVELHDQPLPEPIPIQPPANNAQQAQYLEPFESMLVTIDGEAEVVGATFSSCSFAVSPSGTARIVRQTRDDGIGQIIPILHTNDSNCDSFPHLKTGDGVTGINGPLIYNFDLFRIVQQQSDGLIINEASLSPVPTPPTLTSNQISIATFNLENHFDGIDDTGNDAEPKPTAVQIATKQTKIAHAISHILGCPTLIGIQEVEKATLLQQIANLVATDCGFAYEVIHLESVDVRGIDVALLADSRRVTVESFQLQQGCTPISTSIVDVGLDCPSGQEPLFSRPPLQVEVMVDERPFTLIINHFKSKRGGEVETEPRRIAQAQHVNGLISTQLAQTPTANIIVMGDFNDYELSPPMQILTSESLTNTLTQIPQSERYSFIFSGAAQLLDGILVTSNLLSLIADVQIFHVNADFPDIWEEDTTPNYLPYRSTDHDLPLLILNLPELVVPTPTPNPPTAVSPTDIPLPTTTPIPPIIDEPPPPTNWGWLAGGLGLITAVFILFWRRKTKP